jgi:hypothetical protein
VVDRIDRFPLVLTFLVPLPVNRPTVDEQ